MMVVVVAIGGVRSGCVDSDNYNFSNSDCGSLGSDTTSIVNLTQKSEILFSLKVLLKKYIDKSKFF